MNNKQLHDKQSITIALLISLLFHVIVIVYPMLYKRDFLYNKQKNEKEWAATKARTTHTPTYFCTHSIDKKNIQKENIQLLETPFNQQEIVENTIDTDATTTTIQQKKYHLTHQQPIAQLQKIPRTLPSFSQLSQGMMNYIQKNGTHSVTMLGKKGKPTDEQLKYERYLERLNQCLHNSFVINAPKQPPCNPPDASLTVHLALNQDGSIYNLALVKSCGNQQIDLYVMHILREASSSFPPVPHYLPHNPFSIHYVIGLKPLYR